MIATSPRDKTKTKQDYGTDPKFWKALNNKYGFSWDLACTKKNCLVKEGKTKAGYFFPKDNAFDYPWSELEGWLYLNPPYADLKPWAKKCYEESLDGAKIVMLTPASVGSKWFNDWVWNKAHVIFLRGRVTFAGETKPYPKDCMISIFDNFHKGCNVWDWRL